MLDLKDISVTFHANTVNERKALDHLSFHVENGDFISVLGTNGAGKSTLLNVISGSIMSDSGTILLDGKDITVYPEYKRAIKKGDRSFFIEKLKELGLGLEDRISTTVGLLSGGQRQALTLLMSTIVTPKLLLLDEHTAALDPKTAASVMDITERIVKENHITTLMITHNMKQALEYGNKTIILNEGKIVKVLEGEERKNTTVDDLLNMYDFV